MHSFYALRTRGVRKMPRPLEKERKLRREIKTGNEHS
jgi:hypothetical protein